MRSVLVYGLTNAIGGIENYLILMQKYLKEDICFVYLVENVEHFIYENTVRENKGEIEYLPDRHRFQEYQEKLREVLKRYKSKTDILYINVSHISFDIFPIKIGLSEGYRVITHSHGAGQEPIKRLRYRIRHTILRNIGNIRLKNSDVERLAVSKRAGDFLYHGKPYKIISPGIEVDRFKYIEKVRKEIRGRYHIEDEIVMGFVGRLVMVKNPLFLIDVLYNCKQQNIKTKLMIVGDGELRDEIKEKAEREGLLEDVLFVGEVKNVQDYYQAMDVLLAPSFSEGMPLGIMEAQSAGIPCICAKGNFPETIDVTGTVKFCELNLGGKHWAKEVKSICAQVVDRVYQNEVVKKSPLNIENAAQRLLEIIG